MKWVEVDTQQAYERIRKKITTLALVPGSLINEQRLSEELDLDTTPVREALKMLIHDDLVFITQRHGLYVADINIPDLEQLSEMRISLESFCARLAALRADSDDLHVFEALQLEQAKISSENSHLLLDLDHKFHKALVRAAGNKYLTRTLDHFFDLSQRLWYVAMPHLDFLSASVAEHLDLVEALKKKDADRAEQIMRDHVKKFYDRVRVVLEKKG
jgi:DNA-binding GntR family transcriptional regulator